MKKNSYAIEIHKVTKKYILHHEKPTFFENIVKSGQDEVFTSLKDINLKINKGEKIGIIGANGSGKTTLLKTIAGITTPTEGTVVTRGRIVSLIDLEAGFHPDLSGLENIYLNGLVIGLTRKEITSKLADIIEFADIGKFIDSPLFTYSMGMKLRLGFAVAVHAEPDILILDESISAGDQRFQKKLEKKMQQFFKANKTILVVSHWLKFLKKNCQKIIWIEAGRIKKKGGLEVIDEYVNFAKR